MHPGQWLLDQQDKYLREGRPAVYSLGRNSLTINLNLADVTLWRSGTYTITGGENRPDAKITLAKDRVIVLSLRGATAQRLTLQSNVNLTLDTRDLVKLETLEMRQGSKLTLNAGGAMAVAEVIRPADTGTAEDTKVYITGGSLDANHTETRAAPCTALMARRRSQRNRFGACLSCRYAPGGRQLLPVAVRTRRGHALGLLPGG